MNFPKKFIASYFLSGSFVNDWLVEFVEGTSGVYRWTDKQDGWSTTCTEDRMVKWFESGSYKLVEDLTPKEVNLPDQFKVQNVDSGIVVTFTKIEDGRYTGSWFDDGEHLSYEYNAASIKEQLDSHILTMLPTYKYPEKFIAVGSSNTYTVTREADGTYVWAIQSTGYRFGPYTEDTMDEFIKSYVIEPVLSESECCISKCHVEEPKNDLIEDIQQFVKETGADVVIDSKGFSVVYGASDFARMKDEVELRFAMDVVKAFHKVFHGE